MLKFLWNEGVDFTLRDEEWEETPLEMVESLFSTNEYA
jgi:hypothetical protein